MLGHNKATCFRIGVFVPSLFVCFFLVVVVVPFVCWLLLSSLSSLMLLLLFGSFLDILGSRFLGSLPSRQLSSTNQQNSSRHKLKLKQKSRAIHTHTHTQFHYTKTNLIRHSIYNTRRNTQNRIAPSRYCVSVTTRDGAIQKQQYIHTHVNANTNANFNANCTHFLHISFYI